MTQNYLYRYLIKREDLGQDAFILEYYSNNPPPTVGSIFHLNQFVGSRHPTKYLIKNIETYPELGPKIATADGNHLSSDSVTVEISVIPA